MAEATTLAAPADTCPEHNLPAYVVIAQIEGQNALQGVVEHSFAMGRDPNRVLICWSSKGASSVLLNAIAGKEVAFVVDGQKQAEHIATHAGPGETLTVYDVTDPALPIIIDWTAWNADNEPCDTTLSGVRNKFKARNAPFVMKEVDA